MPNATVLPPRAYGANQDGQHLIRQRQFSQAIALFERQKKANPSDPQPYFYAGMAFSQAQDWSGAVVEFKEAVRLDPGNPKYIISHSNALARAGEHELARAALKSLGKAPWQQLDPRLAWLLGDTYYQIGEHDQALEVLDFLAEAGSGECECRSHEGPDPSPQRGS